MAQRVMLPDWMSCAPLEVVFSIWPGARVHFGVKFEVENGKDKVCTGVNIYSKFYLVLLCSSQCF